MFSFNWNPKPRSKSLKRRTPRCLAAIEELETRSLLTAVAAPSGLVSWWGANGTAADVMGLNNATLLNGTTYAAGEVGQAFSFDGVNDRAQPTCRSPTTFKFGTRSFLRYAAMS